MVEIADLIMDEKEAIENYEQFLKHHMFTSADQIHKVKKILEDEKRHLRILRGIY